MIGIKLQNHKKISITDNIEEFDSPNFVYIPLSNRGDDNTTVFIKKNDYVYKNQLIAKVKGKYAIPIFSSVSGVVSDIIPENTIHGKLKCAVIKNDFKELEEERNRVEIKTKEEFIKLLYDCGVVGLGGGAYPTYLKYKQAKNIETLIVNCVEGEPYVTSDYMIVNNYIQDVLETLDKIMNIFDIKECFIAILVASDALKEKIKSHLGIYPKIKLIEVPNLYPMGWEKYLVRYIKHLDYDNIPTDKEIIVNNISTIYSIYEAFKYQKPQIDRIVTFSGDSINNPHNIRIKIGTKIKEVLPKLSVSDSTIINGGVMMGGLACPDTIITKESKAILFMKNVVTGDIKDCIKCGKCVRVCPVKLSPVVICDNVDNEYALKKLNVSKCISCGLCSYICPAKIEVRKYIKEALNKIESKK